MYWQPQNGAYANSEMWFAVYVGFWGFWFCFFYTFGFFSWEGRRVALCISWIKITNSPLTVMTFPSNIPFMVILSLIFLLASCPFLSAPHNSWKILYEEHLYLQKWLILVWVLVCCFLFYPGQFMLFCLVSSCSHILWGVQKCFKTGLPPYYW